MPGFLPPAIALLAGGAVRLRDAALDHPAPAAVTHNGNFAKSVGFPIPARRPSRFGQPGFRRTERETIIPSRAHGRRRIPATIRNRFLIDITGPAA
jgi:hypothetical protein